MGPVWCLLAWEKGGGGLVEEEGGRPR
jgi:hypothetical protein